MKKVFIGKTLDDAIEAGAKEFQVAKEELVYIQLEDKKGVFGIGTKAQIEAYEISDILRFIELYVTKLIDAYGIGIELVSATNDNGVIHVEIDTVHNAVLIGSRGDTLKALNDLVRHVLNSKFRRHFRVSLNIGDYKDRKYEKILKMAKRLAQEVVKSKTDVSLDPMSSDERRIIHGELSGMEHIKTESIGTGKDRRIVIKYIE